MLMNNFHKKYIFKRKTQTSFDKILIRDQVKPLLVLLQSLIGINQNPYWKTKGFSR